MANELTIQFDCRVHIFAYMDYDVMPSAPTSTDLVPSGWSDVPEQQLSTTKMNVWSYSDYDFENSCSLGNWSDPIVVTGEPLSGALDYGFNFGYSDDANTPPSTFGKILASPTGDYMWMEKFRIINSEAIRTLDFILINNESEQYTNYFRGDIIREYNYVSESMNTRIIGDAKVYKNTSDADYYYTGKEYVIYNNEKYYLDVKSISKSYNKDAAKYTYSLSFNNEYNKLFTTPFKNIATINEEPQFYTNSNVINFVGNVGELKDRINACLTKSYSSYMYQVSYDSGYSPVLTNYQQVNAENIAIFDALKIFYDVFSVPFYIEGYDIILGREPNDIGHTFEYGNGIKEMTKGKSKDYVTTSVSGKGGQTNIPYRYPEIRDADGIVINHPYTSTYLMPTCYVQSVRRKVQTQAIDYDPNIFIVNSYEAKPNDVYIDENGVYHTAVYENYINANNYAHEFVDFDEIFPTITGVMYSGQRIDQIKSVSYEDADTLIYTDDSKDIAPFYIELYPLGFDLYAHAIETGEMTFSMNSGACSGCQFKVLGLNNLRYTAQNVHFAIAGNTTYDANDFRVYFDSTVWDLLQEAIDYSQVVDPSAAHTETWNRKVRDYIKGKVINGLTVNQILKQNIDYLMKSEDIYCNMRNMYVDIVAFGEYEVGDNEFHYLSTLVNELNTKWDIGLTYAGFATLCSNIRTHVQLARNIIENTNQLFLKDYADRTYPPLDLYVRGSFFIESTRDTTAFPDSTNASITVKVLKDDSTYGTILPNQFIKPKANDTFVILNIDMPSNYLEAAQRRLDKALRDYLVQKNKDNANYTIELSQVFLGNNLTIYNKIKTDTYMNFKFKDSLVTQQIKKITKKYKSNFPEVSVEFYSDEEKKKSIGNKIVTLQQIVASTRREVNVNRVNNRKLLTQTTEKIVGIETQQTTTDGLVESKNKMFVDTPIPPYRQGDTWNDGTVLRRCNNTKTEGQSYSSGDWDIAVKTQQFIKTIEKELNNNIEYEQSLDFQTRVYEIDNDANFVLHNNEISKTENIVIIKNINGVKDLSLTIDITDISGSICNLISPINVELNKSIEMKIKYTDEKIAVITITSGLITL